MAAKRLTMVSLGPGDAELITLKGLHALQEADAVCIPTKSEDGSFTRSVTYDIIETLASRYTIDAVRIPVYTPMRFRPDDWKRQADIVAETCKNYTRVCFVTLGDSAIYSSVYYVAEMLQKHYPDIYETMRVIPGITSFSEASARLKRPLCLGESGVEIVPLCNLQAPKTRIYMRPRIGMRTDTLPAFGETVTLENLHFDNERISRGWIPVVKRYMTLFIDFVTKEST